MLERFLAYVRNNPIALLFMLLVFFQALTWLAVVFKHVPQTYDCGYSYRPCVVIIDQQDKLAKAIADAMKSR